MTESQEKTDDKAKAVEEEKEEYEYVEIGEVAKPYADKVFSVLAEHDVVVLCFLLAVGCIVLSLLFKGGNIVLTIVIITLLGVFFAFGLYVAWKEKKKAEHEYEKAKAIYEELQRQMKIQGGGDDDGDDGDE